MPEPAITILTGPVHSGKTTYLINQYSGNEKVYGILTPVINNKRMFMNLSTKEIFPMEADEEEKNVLSVGKYSFSKKAFDKAINIVNEGLHQQEGILIVDEAGPLELKEKGFYEVVKKILTDTNPHLKKIIVVRETILQEVISFFKIIDYKILKL